MEFVPAPKIMQKLIERATQIDYDKIDSLLNPYDKRLIGAPFLEIGKLGQVSESVTADLRCKQKNFYYPTLLKKNAYLDLGLTEDFKINYLKKP